MPNACYDKGTPFFFYFVDPLLTNVNAYGVIALSILRR